MEGREISFLDDERKSYKYLTPETEWTRPGHGTKTPTESHKQKGYARRPDILSAAILKARRERGFFNMSVLAFMFSRFLRLEP